MRFNASSIDGGIFGPPTERPTSARRNQSGGRADSVGTTLFADGNTWAAPDKTRERLQPELQEAAGVIKVAPTENEALRPLPSNAHHSSIDGGIFGEGAAQQAKSCSKHLLVDRNASSIKGGVFGYSAEENCAPIGAVPSVVPPSPRAVVRDHNASSIPGGIFG
eukprot:CAMPEP_0183330970 /NCGR_PEP_ID=MMETSP0164_2-20130417/401_1 /TAXON_ID=221442 /ORGANISM="Coccolithus pelagicus ssp braarudi, Strain PLY182g" /LENGTH=163 /DNA_ID=CAMNT_0025499323 /DNA_START=26 /DNA_END=517 /DNA_ORIENTATION=+